jgi:hypothetical protein
MMSFIFGDRLCGAGLAVRERELGLAHDTTILIGTRCDWGSV